MSILDLEFENQLRIAEIFYDEEIEEEVANVFTSS
jgi:hypothetical protein